jgi:hypothetical protein
VVVLWLAAQNGVISRCSPKLFLMCLGLNRDKDIFVFRRIDSARLNSRHSPLQPVEWITLQDRSCAIVFDFWFFWEDRRESSGFWGRIPFTLLVPGVIEG